MEARLDTPRKFYLLPAAHSLALDGLLTLKVYKNDYSAQISGSPYSGLLLVEPAAAAAEGVYEAGPVTFPAAGTYHLLWECSSPSFKISQTVTVLEDPVGDFPAEINQRARYETPNYTAQADIVLRIIDEDGEFVGGTRTTTATAVTGVYLTTEQFSLGSGVYLLLWTSATGGYSYTRIEQWLVLAEATQRTVTIFAHDSSSTPDVPIADVDVLVSETDGTPVTQGRTGAAGKVQLQLLDGDYVVTLRKTGTVFSRNNVEITVSSTGDNTTYIIADPFTPTFDSVAPFAVGSKSTLTLDLVDASGSPIQGVRVFVYPTITPSTATSVQGVAVGFNSKVHLAVTDATGHAELVLLRGQTVTAWIEASDFRRTFVVPSASTFNLLTVTPVESDPLSVVVSTTTAAERRS